MKDSKSGFLANKQNLKHRLFPESIFNFKAKFIILDIHTCIYIYIHTRAYKRTFKNKTNLMDKSRYPQKLTCTKNLKGHEDYSVRQI